MIFSLLMDECERQEADVLCSEDIVAHNEERLGWKPVWTKEKFFKRIDEEVQAVVELGKARSSLIDSLRQAARG